MVEPETNFAKYLKATLAASAAFGLVHGAEEFIFGVSGIRLSGINFTGFLVLIPFELIQSAAFFIICMIVMAFPAKIISRNFSRIGLRKIIFFGFILGLLFLPLCALVAYIVLPLPGAPSYWARCGEFALPMAIAGAVGAYIYGREIGGPVQADKSISNLFS